MVGSSCSACRQMSECDDLVERLPLSVMLLNFLIATTCTGFTSVAQRRKPDCNPFQVSECPRVQSHRALELEFFGSPVHQLRCLHGSQSQEPLQMSPEAHLGNVLSQVSAVKGVFCPRSQCGKGAKMPWRSGTGSA